MKKIFSFFAAVLFAGSMMAQVTIAGADNAITATDDGFTLSVSGFEFTALKNDGATKPTQNGSSNDYRLYAKNTLQVTSDDNMTEMVFAISTAGKKRLTDITASTGSVVIDASAWTVTWTGSAADVTFTVGEKATYGTETGKAGQFDFDAVTITTGEGGDPTPTKVTVSLTEVAEGIQITVSDQTVPYHIGLDFQSEIPNQAAAEAYMEEEIASMAGYPYSMFIEYDAPYFYSGDLLLTWEDLRAENGDELAIVVFTYAGNEEDEIICGSNVAYLAFSYEEKQEVEGVFTTNVEFVAGTNSYLTDKIIIDGEEYDAFKIGTSSKAGSCSVILPKGTTKFSFYAIGWSKSGNTDLTISGAYEETVVITGGGISGNSPYTFDLTFTTPDKHFYSHTFAEALEEDTELVFSCDYRAVFFGANVEGDVVTGINNTVAENVVKTMENGQLVIIRDGVRYNAQGIRF